MIIEQGKEKPIIHETAYIAPNAVVSGNVTIEEGVRILYGAVITAEGSPVIIKKNTIIMENAVLRSAGKFNLKVGKQVLIGPHAYITGCTIEDGSFIASGAKVYNGAVVGIGSIVAIGGVVHVNTHLPKKSRVPIYNVAIGSPSAIYSPNQVNEIGAELQNIDFLGSVFNVSSDIELLKRMNIAIEKYTNYLEKHKEDKDIV